MMAAQRGGVPIRPRICDRVRRGTEVGGRDGAMPRWAPHGVHEIFLAFPGRRVWACGVSLRHYEWGQIEILHDAR
jgi:hypothetical protein